MAIAADRHAEVRRGARHRYQAAAGNGLQPPGGPVPYLGAAAGRARTEANRLAEVRGNARDTAQAHPDAVGRVSRIRRALDLPPGAVPHLDEIHGGPEA